MIPREEIDDLYLRYAEALDDDRLEEWPALFAEDASYRVVSRDNVERGLPVATMRCDSRAMMEDRVFALREANFYVPRRIRHLVGPLRVHPAGEHRWTVRASYAVFETLPQAPTTVLAVGAYEDVVVREGDGALRFAEKRCVNDSELVPNSFVFPF